MKHKAWRKDATAKVKLTGTNETFYRMPHLTVVDAKGRYVRQSERPEVYDVLGPNTRLPTPQEQEIFQPLMASVFNR